jgi:hypothetical protein
MGTFATSNLVANNDFYFFKHPGGTFALRLNYSSVGGTGTEADIDLYLYDSRGRYGVSNDIKAYSYKEPDGNAATAEFESFSKNLPSGDYLINVRVFTRQSTFPGNPVEYTLTYGTGSGAKLLCPSPKF